jgi:diguanylate cyclase (GGDEF)-like protein
MGTQEIRPREERSLFSFAQIQHLLRVEFGRARRYGYPLSLLCVAIDQLGALRDQLGFEGKEAVVEEVTRELFALTRSSDSIGRTPDDRLIALLPHTDPAGRDVLARRVLQSVRELDPAAARGEHLTVSLGAASTRREQPVFHDELLQAAEAALSEASAGGGDRLVQAP